MKLPPRLTLDEAAAVLRTLPADGAVRVIDASALRDFDSAALAVLLQARRQARAGGHDLQVLAAPPKLRQLAQLYGVDGPLGLAAG